MTYAAQPYRPPQDVPPVPAPARRKRRAGGAVVAIVVTAVLLLCYGGWATGAVWVVRRAERTEQATPTPTPAPTGPVTGGPTRPPRSVVVVYEVTGNGRADINYLDSAGRTATLLKGARLPWRVELPRQPTRLARVTAFRSEQTSGPVTCRLLVDGAEVARSSDQAGYSSVSCTEVIRPN